jgi:histidinol-phosphate aminotransferase
VSPAIPPIRADLAGREPYLAAPPAAPVRLNVNENPWPPPPEVAGAIADAVAAEIGSLNRYPDATASRLREDLAGYLGHGLSRDRVWAANGSNEIIQQLLLAFGGPGRSALGFEPSYSMHPIIAQVTGTRWIAAGRGEDFGLDAARLAAALRGHRPDVVFLTSPNNPTGTAVGPGVIEAACEQAGGLVVVDEAYAEFARDPAGTALALLPRYPNLVVTRTMSKAFALAGARVGYLAADPAVVRALAVVRLPFHLSAITQAVARAALAHAGSLLAGVDKIRAERDDLVGWLRSRGLSAAQSDANFVLYGVFADRHAVWRALLERGVLIREAGPPGWLRVSVGTDAEMAAFRAAMDAVLAGSGVP